MTIPLASRSPSSSKECGVPSFLPCQQPQRRSRSSDQTSSEKEENHLLLLFLSPLPHLLTDRQTRKKDGQRREERGEPTMLCMAARCTPPPPPPVPLLGKNSWANCSFSFPSFFCPPITPRFLFLLYSPQGGGGKKIGRANNMTYRGKRKEGVVYRKVDFAAGNLAAWKL